MTARTKQSTQQGDAMSPSPFIKPTSPTLSAFLSGKPVEPIGFVSGRPVYPIAGGAEDPPAPERPGDIPEVTWDALGDPGKAALVEERGKRQEAERQLAAARARPAPPKQTAQTTPPATSPTTPAGQQEPPQQPDIEAIVKQAVEAATKPFVERETRREADAAAQKIADAVTAAAKDLLYDPTDALANVDLTKVTDGNGAVAPDKVKTELDALLQRKPHLARPGVRQAPAGIGSTPGNSATPTTDDLVKASLARMQKSVNLRPAPSGQR